MAPRVHAAFLRAPAGSHPAREAAAILDTGYRGIVLASPLHDHSWEALRTAVPRGSISAIEVFLPLPRGVRPEAHAPFSVAATHPEERRDSARQACETVLAAERAAIPLVLVPPEPLGAMPSGPWPGERDPHREERLARLLAERQAVARPGLDSLLGVLSKMLSAADRYGVTIALSPGGLPGDFPSPEEAAACLSEFRGAPLRIWIDTWARALARSFAPSGNDPFAALGGEEPAGATLRDATRDGKPASPGQGTVEWESEKPILERCRVWAVDPPGAGGVRGLDEAREFLERLGAPPRGAPSGGILGIG